MSNGAAISLNVVEALQIARRSFPVPGIAIAAGVALSIFEIVQKVKTNKEEFITIGRDSCFIVETIIQKMQVGQGGQVFNDPMTLRHADVLVADLRYIEGHVRKAKERSGVKRLFSYRLDQGAIQDCRERLTRAMMTFFCFQYDFEIRRQLANVHHLLIVMHEGSSSHLSSRLQPQPQWQMPSSSFPPPSQQTQTPSISTIQLDQSPNFPILAASPPRPQTTQELGTEQGAGGGQAQTSEITQQQMDMTPSNSTGSPARVRFNSFRNATNHLSPGVGYPYIVGCVNDTRDDSFNVIGTGNHIYLSFGR